MRNPWTHPWLLLFALLLPVPAISTPDLLPPWNSDTPSTHWEPAGRDTIATLDPNAGKTGGPALHIADRGDQIGQATSPRIKVTPDEMYFIRLWVKIDPDLPGTVVVDTLHLAEDGSLRGGAKSVATVQKAGWVRVSRVLQPRQGADFMQIRVMPAAGEPRAHGACWIDEVVVKRTTDVTAEDLDLNRTVSASTEDPPIRPSATILSPTSVGGYDFEDLAGWKLRVSDQMDVISLAASRDQACLNDYVARLQYKTASPGQTVVLTPPVPIEIQNPFDSITLWIFQHFYGFVTANVPWEIGPTPRVLLEDAKGQPHNIELSRVTWQNWSIARGKLAQPVETPAWITGIAFDNLPASHDVSGASGETVLTPRFYYVDALQCVLESDQPLDLAIPPPPLSESAATFRPRPSGTNVSKRIFQEGDAYVLQVVSGEDTLRYEYHPRTGLPSDLRVNGIVPFSDQGVVFDIDGETIAMSDPSVHWTLVNAGVRGDKILAIWSYEISNTRGSLVYHFSIEDASLSMLITSTEQHIRGFVRGDIGAKNVEGIFVPFLNWSGWWQDSTVALVDDRLFLSRFNDVYRSDCSTIRFDGQHLISDYHPRTDGHRNPIKDRWLITASSKLEDVLPHIRHPANAAAKRFAGYVYARDLIPYRSEEDREGGLRYLRLCKRYGIDRLMIKLTHLSVDKEDWGLLPAMNVYDQVPRTVVGGEKAFTQYFRDIQELGFKVLLYTDYHQLDPLAEFWNPDYAVQRSDGNWMDSWRHCYRLSPLAAPTIVKDMTRRISEKFGIDGTYLDESGSFPWGAITDYDARKPGAGLARVAHLAQLRIPVTEQNIHGGPSYGEGSAQWLWAGFLSGTYGQTYWPSWDHQTAWLVDFELCKVHPLMTNLSMGYALNRYGGLPEAERQWALDRWHAAAMAFGRAGAFKIAYESKSDSKAMKEPRWLWKEKREIFQEYFLFQALQEGYAMVPPKEIAYEADGRWFSAGEALREDRLQENHIRVVYENGLQVFVNGNLDVENAWNVRVDGKDILLPQNGFAFASSNEKLLGFGARIDGHRADFVDGRRDLYAHARGVTTQFPNLKTSGCVVIRKDLPGVWDVVLVSGDSVLLDVEWLRENGLRLDRIQAMDEDENVLPESESKIENGRLELSADSETISYRIELRQ